MAHETKVLITETQTSESWTEVLVKTEKTVYTCPLCKEHITMIAVDGSVIYGGTAANWRGKYRVDCCPSCSNNKPFQKAIDLGLLQGVAQCKKCGIMWEGGGTVCEQCSEI
jgi:rubrerythrin